MLYLPNTISGSPVSQSSGKLLCIVIVFRNIGRVKVSGSGRDGLLCCGPTILGHQLSELSILSDHISSQHAGQLARRNARRSGNLDASQNHFLLSHEQLEQSEQSELLSLDARDARQLRLLGNCYV